MLYNFSFVYIFSPLRSYTNDFPTVLGMTFDYWCQFLIFVQFEKLQHSFEEKYVSGTSVKKKFWGSFEHAQQANLVNYTEEPSKLWF